MIICVWFASTLILFFNVSLNVCELSAIESGFLLRRNWKWRFQRLLERCVFMNQLYFLHTRFNLLLLLDIAERKFDCQIWLLLPVLALLLVVTVLQPTFPIGQNFYDILFEIIIQIWIWFNIYATKMSFLFCFCLCMLSGIPAKADGLRKETFISACSSSLYLYFAWCTSPFQLPWKLVGCYCQKHRLY